MQIFVVVREAKHYQLEPRELRGSIIELRGSRQRYQDALELAKKILPSDFTKIQALPDGFEYQEETETPGTFVEVQLTVKSTTLDW